MGRLVRVKWETLAEQRAADRLAGCTDRCGADGAGRGGGSTELRRCPRAPQRPPRGQSRPSARAAPTRPPRSRRRAPQEGEGSAPERGQAGGAPTEQIPAGTGVPPRLSPPRRGAEEHGRGATTFPEVSAGEPRQLSPASLRGSVPGLRAGTAGGARVRGRQQGQGTATPVSPFPAPFPALLPRRSSPERRPASCSEPLAFGRLTAPHTRPLRAAALPCQLWRGPAAAAPASRLSPAALRPGGAGGMKA